MATLTGNVTETQNWFPLSSVDLAAGFYTIDSENVEVGGRHFAQPARPWNSVANGRFVKRGVAGSTAASHSSGATLTRYYPEAPSGAGSGGITVDNTIDPPAAVSSLVIPGATVAAGSATGGAIQSATLPLTNAQVKALATTRQTIVASPGAGKAIVPLFGLLTANFAVAYGGIAADSEYPELNIRGTSNVLGPVQDEPDTPATDLTTFLTTTEPLTWWLLPAAFNRSPGATNYSYIGAQPTANLGGALTIGIDNNGGNLSGGDAANTLAVTVLYAVVDL